MRLCLPARIGGGGKAESLPWRGPAGEARHTGAAILLREREGKALGVPAYQETGPVRLPSPQRATNNGTLARRNADGWCVRATVRQRPSDKKRGKSASGSVQKHRTLKERSGKECGLRKSRSFSHAPDRHPKGQDHRLGPRQRIERVAVRQRTT
jgi:hypothetical protein